MTGKPRRRSSHGDSICRVTVARAAATGQGGAVFIEDQGPLTEWARAVPRLMQLPRGSVPVVNGRGSLKRNSMRHLLSPVTVFDIFSYRSDTYLL